MKKTNNDFGFSTKTTTDIWYEKPQANNPYAVEEAYLHGYNIVDLAEKKSFVEVLLLLLKGELPSQQDVRVLNILMIGLINPGPRHPATRAAMTAGVSKSNAQHLLPIGLMVLSGEFNGAAEVEQAMHFFQKNINFSISKLIEEKLNSEEQHLMPGVGSKYGSKDEVCCKLANKIIDSCTGSKYLPWLQKVIDEIDNDKVGWLPTGLAAATFLDLGINPREGGVLFQLISSPGILAHGLEQTHKPLTAIPLLEDEQYELTEKN